jgi:large subunit ribosomal protein L11
MAKKKITSYVKIEIPAGKANPAPPIGTALGPRGINIMEFCKAFNEATKSMEPNSPIPVVISIYADRSFSFITKTPPVAYFLKKHAKIKKGSSETKKGLRAGKVTMDQVREIAKIKLEDTNAYDIESAARIVKGSAESMGIEVIGN